MYASDGASFVVRVGWPEQKRWWRNLRGGAPVTTLVQGRQLDGVGEVVNADPLALAAAWEPYLRRYPRSSAAKPLNDAVFVRIKPVPSG